MRQIINAVCDFLISRPRWQFRAACYVVCGLLVYAFLHRTIREARDDGRQEVRDSLSAIVASRYHRTIDTLGKRIDRETVTVIRTTHRLDTLWQQLPAEIVTRAETVQVLNHLPVLRAATDSAVQACSELSRTCVQYRVYAESAFKADSTVIRGLQRAVERAKPSKSQTVLKWAEVAAAFYLGRRLK